MYFCQLEWLLISTIIIAIIFLNTQAGYFDKHFTRIILFHPPNNPIKLTCFTDEKTEVQRG